MQQQDNSIPDGLVWIMVLGLLGLVGLAFLFKGHTAF